LKIARPGADNAEVLAWLECALEHARHQGQSRLEDLLKIVRADILFEMRLTIGALDGKPLSDGEIS
jgi:hypothetical protein